MPRHPRVLTLACLASALATLTAPAAAAPKPAAAATLKVLQSEVAAADAAVDQARAQSPDRTQDDPAIDRLAEAAYQKRLTAFTTALDLANTAPESDAGFDSLEWLLTNAPTVHRVPAGKAALELMAAHYATDPRIATAVGRVALYPPYGLPIPRDKSIPEYSDAYAPAMRLLKTVAETNPNPRARGQAALGLALQAKHACQYTEYRAAPDAARLRAQAEQALAAVIKDYRDVPCLGARKGTPTLGDRAAAELFELQKLQPGNPAPEIAGQDLTGADLKLSDYRGKVVLLVFWASWCGPCMAQVPHERALLDRFKDKPFAIVGVNGDEDRDQALHAAASNQIPWRSFWNGPDGPYGPITTAWSVHFFPTAYVLDAHGIIRHTQATTDENLDLDAALDKLVAQAPPATRPTR